MIRCLGMSLCGTCCMVLVLVTSSADDTVLGYLRSVPRNLQINRSRCLLRRRRRTRHAPLPTMTCLLCRRDVSLRPQQRQRHPMPRSCFFFSSAEAGKGEAASRGLFCWKVMTPFFCCCQGWRSAAHGQLCRALSDFPRQSIVRTAVPHHHRHHWWSSLWAQQQRAPYCYFCYCYCYRPGVG